MSLDPQLEKQLRHFWFKYLNKFMLLMWRLGLGWMMNMWPDVFGQIMVIINTGWKTGLRRRTPVNYAIVNGELYCTAGFGQVAHWYRNIQANTLSALVHTRAVPGTCSAKSIAKPASNENGSIVSNCFTSP